LTNYVARKTKLLERSRNKQNISLIILKMQNLLHRAEQSKDMILKENQSTSKSKLSFFVIGAVVVIVPLPIAGGGGERANLVKAGQA
jgi:hypothetical protein